VDTLARPPPPPGPPQARASVEERIAIATETLSRAERLSGEDALRILSALRLGERIGMATGIDGAAFSELLVTMRIGAQYLAGDRSRYAFFEETRRPALIRNKIREQQRSGSSAV
jgi:protein-arginine kinase